MASWQMPSGEMAKNCVVFFRVREEFGELSNMASGFPLMVNGQRVPSSEALFQACRFPHRPDWQREIIASPSGFAAKLMAKKDGRRAHQSRADWEAVRLPVMEWVLRVKLAWNWPVISGLLRASGDGPLVEKSRRDSFWGAVEGSDRVLRGENQLGRSWMKLRQELWQRSRENMQVVEPPQIPEFHIFGEPIGSVRVGAKRNPLGQLGHEKAAVCP
jgi:type I restriction enzyme S subunit